MGRPFHSLFLSSFFLLRLLFTSVSMNGRRIDLRPHESVGRRGRRRNQRSLRPSRVPGADAVAAGETAFESAAQDRARPSPGKQKCQDADRYNGYEMPSYHLLVHKHIGFYRAGGSDDPSPPFHTLASPIVISSTLMIRGSLAILSKKETVVETAGNLYLDGDLFVKLLRHGLRRLALGGGRFGSRSRRCLASWRSAAGLFSGGFSRHFGFKQQKIHTGVPSRQRPPTKEAPRSPSGREASTGPA